VVVVVLLVTRAQEWMLAPHLNPVLRLSTCRSTATATVVSRVRRVRCQHMVESRLHRTAGSINTMTTAIGIRRRRRISLFAKRGGVKGIAHGLRGFRCGSPALLRHRRCLTAEGFGVLG